MYMGPEVYGEGAELKSDVWALGMSVIEMAESKNPFARCTSAQVMNRVMNMPPPSLSSSGWSSDLVDFVSACLVKDVNARSSVEALLKHPFVKDSIERIVKNGNSALLCELVKRVGNAGPSKATTGSMNVVAMTMLNHPLAQKEEKELKVEDEGVLENHEKLDTIERTRDEVKEEEESTSMGIEVKVDNDHPIHRKCCHLSDCCSYIVFLLSVVFLFLGIPCMLIGVFENNPLYLTLGIVCLIVCVVLFVVLFSSFFLVSSNHTYPNKHSKTPNS